MVVAMMTTIIMTVTAVMVMMVLILQADDVKHTLSLLPDRVNVIEKDHGSH